jgi:hypothetical protein
MLYPEDEKSHDFLGQVSQTPPMTCLWKNARKGGLGLFKSGTCILTNLNDSCLCLAIHPLKKAWNDSL